MPKRRILDNTTEYGKAMRRFYNKQSEEIAKQKIKEAEDEKWQKWSDFVNDPLEMNNFEKNLQKTFKEIKQKKKSSKKMLFITLNWDEKLVTPTGTVDYVKKIITHPKVEKYYVAWEWRDHEKETGLHTHILLQGDTRQITQYCKRQKGPFIKLCSEFHTLKKYPIAFWEDKIEYVNGETYEEEKTEKKKGDSLLRKKYELPNLFN